MGNGTTFAATALVYHIKFFVFTHALSLFFFYGHTIILGAVVFDIRSRESFSEPLWGGWQ